MPYDIHVHDYAWLCAPVALVGPARRYCGEPDVRMRGCVADAGSERRTSRSPRCAAAPRAARGRAAGDGAVARMPRRGSARHFPADAPGGGSRTRTMRRSATRLRAGRDRSLPRLRDRRDRRAQGLRRAARLRARCRGAAPAAGIRRGRPHHRRSPAARDRARLRHRRLRGGRGRGADQGAERDSRAAAVDLAGDMVLHASPRPGGPGCAWWRSTSARRPSASARTGRGLLLPLGLPARAINNALLAAVGLSQRAMTLMTMSPTLRHLPVRRVSVPIAPAVQPRRARPRMSEAGTAVPKPAAAQAAPARRRMPEPRRRTEGLRPSDDAGYRRVLRVPGAGLAGGE